MHITIERAKTILMNILNDLPKEMLLEEEEISIAEPKLLPKTSQPLATVEPELPQKEEEEFPLPDFCLILTMICLLILEIPQIII
jgi:hypothetical protein